MPQSSLEFVRGYLHLTADTLTQRLRLPTTPAHQLFQADGEYLAERTAIVTGANTGIGLETARMLAGAGATVILACRNLEKAAIASHEIRKTHPKAQLEISRLDLADLSSVRAFADKFSSRPLHMLILNGGVMGVAPSKPETHFMVNHVGHALLIIKLLRSIDAGTGRIVFISSLTFLISDLHWDDLSFEKRRYNWMTAYANSKLCMILFMHALKARLKGSAVTVNAVHPGEATSDVARNLGRIWMGLHKNVGQLFLLNISESARTSVYVAGARELNSDGDVYHRVTEVLPVAPRFLKQEDIDRAWEVTLEAAQIAEEELSPITEIATKGINPGCE